MIKNTEITGDANIDTEIRRWIKGVQDQLSVEMMINEAMSVGTLPRFDDQGREWTAEMIMDYALMITRY